MRGHQPPAQPGLGAGQRTGTGITGCDMAVTWPWPPDRPCRSWGSAVLKGRTKLCLLFAGEGRRQRSRWGSFPYGQTTRQLIRGVSPGYCFTRARKEKSHIRALNSTWGSSTQPGEAGLEKFTAQHGCESRAYPCWLCHGGCIIRRK